jgi:hypothetical protein
MMTDTLVGVSASTTEPVEARRHAGAGAFGG